jgi:hypothetical protein
MYCICTAILLQFHKGIYILFVYLFVATWAIFQLSGGCHHYWWQGCKFRPMLGTQGLRAGRGLYRAAPTATQGLGFIRSHPKDRHPQPKLGFEPPTQGSSDLCPRRSNHCATQVTFVKYFTNLKACFLQNNQKKNMSFFITVLNIKLFILEINSLLE